MLVETRANNTDIFIIGTPTLEVVGESLGYDPPLYTTLNWNIDFDVDNTNGALLIKATIENEKPGRVIKWRATAKTSEIGFS